MAKDKFSAYVLYIVLAVVVFAVITLIFGLNKPGMTKVGEAPQVKEDIRPVCNFEISGLLGIYLKVGTGAKFGECPDKCNNYEPFSITPVFYLKSTTPICENCGTYIYPDPGTGTSGYKTKSILPYSKLKDVCNDFAAAHAEYNEQTLLKDAQEECRLICEQSKHEFKIEENTETPSSICKYKPCSWEGDACGKHQFDPGTGLESVGCADCNKDKGVIEGVEQTLLEVWECHGPRSGCTCIKENVPIPGGEEVPIPGSGGEVGYIPGGDGGVAIADAGGTDSGTTTTSGKTSTTTGTSTGKGKSLA